MRTLLVSLLVAGAFLAALAPAAEAASMPCTSLTSFCPGVVCTAYDPRTGHRANCVGEPEYCWYNPCPPPQDDTP